MAADIGYGITFGIYNGATYTNVALVTSCTPPQFARDAVDTTHMLSTSKYREFVPGLINGGSPSITINYAPSNADVLVTALQASTLGSFRITFSNAVTVTFSGVPTAYQPGSMTPDSKMTATFTLQISGIPVWA